MAELAPKNHTQDTCRSRYRTVNGILLRMPIWAEQKCPEPHDVNLATEHAASVVETLVSTFCV